MKSNLIRIRDIVFCNKALCLVPVLQLAALNISTAEVFSAANASVLFEARAGRTLGVQTIGLDKQELLRGRVLDAQGKPLLGAEITNLKSKVVVVTGANGEFAIQAFSADVLRVRLIGFESRELLSSVAQVITLKESVTDLDEVVVVGYGTQKKSAITGAVSTMKLDEATAARGLSNVSQALSGMIPGLAVSQNSGMAGNNAADVLIRGLGSSNNAGPLIVVDGMPDVNMNRVNVNDIESVTVLKDAASAAVYGSRGANGVILITTKSGKRNTKATISASGTWSSIKPTSNFDFVNNYARAMTATQRAQSINVMPTAYNFRNATVDKWLAMSMIDPRLYPSTDWWDVVLRDGQSANYNVNATGGTENSNYYLSAGMLDEKGIQIGNDFKRYNTAFNFDTNISKKISTGLRFAGNWSKYKYNYEDGMTANSGSGLDLFTSPAGILPYDPLTGWYGGAMAHNESVQANNIYADYMVRNLNNMEQKQALLNGYIDWKPLKGLSARAEYAINYDNRFQWKADMPTELYNIQTESVTRTLVSKNEGIYNTDRENYKTQLNFRVAYDTSFGENHSLSALGVYSEEYWKNRILTGSRLDRLHPNLHELDAASKDVQTSGGSSSAEGLRSYIGRLHYGAFKRYIVEGSFRVDGSSKFLPGDQYGFFPSGSIGWVISEEPFFQNLKSKILVSNAKLRASYGSLGNNSGVGVYEQQEMLTSNPYYVGTNIVSGLINKRLVNYDLTWEKTTVFNVGLDLAFFDNRLTTELEYYKRLTTGLNRPSDISVHLSGLFVAPRRNIGEMENRGVEANVTWNDKFGEDIRYLLNFNIGYNKNKLLSWNEQLQRGSVFIDMPFNFVYAFQAIGVAQTWEDVYNATPQGAAPGDILMKDINGDGKIDANDRVAYPAYQLGRPKVNFGFRGNVAWRGFDLSLLLQGASGRKEFWMNRANASSLGTANQAVTVDQWENTWNLDNRNALYPRLLPSTLMANSPNSYLSTYWLQDMTYLRVKNIQLGYTFRQNLLKELGVGKLRVYGSMDNVAVFTKFKGLDPEKSSYSNDAYPITKSFVFGLNVEF